MAFRDGIGPEQGFNGYSVREQDDSQTNPPASEGTR